MAMPACYTEFPSCATRPTTVLYNEISTREKHRIFTMETVGDKPVIVLPGLSPDLGGKLIDKGFKKAYTVIGQWQRERRLEKRASLQLEREASGRRREADVKRRERV